MTRSIVTIIGAGGFGREALDTVVRMANAGIDISLRGVADDNPSPTALRLLTDRGIEYLGSIQDWLGIALPTEQFVVAIGSPAVRAAIEDRMLAGRNAATLVDPRATLGTETVLEEGVIICAGAVISTNVHLRRSAHVNPGAVIGHDTRVGAFSSINPGAVVSGNVSIGKAVLVGANATILQDLTIGDNAIIGAGAVVTKDVAPQDVVAGVPARKLEAQ